MAQAGGERARPLRPATPRFGLGATIRASTAVRAGKVQLASLYLRRG